MAKNISGSMNGPYPQKNRGWSVIHSKQFAFLLEQQPKVGIQSTKNDTLSSVVLVIRMNLAYKLISSSSYSYPVAHRERSA